LSQILCKCCHGIMRIVNNKIVYNATFIIMNCFLFICTFTVSWTWNRKQLPATTATKYFTLLTVPTQTHFPPTANQPPTRTHTDAQKTSQVSENNGSSLKFSLSLYPDIFLFLLFGVIYRLTSFILSLLFIKHLV